MTLKNFIEELKIRKAAHDMDIALWREQSQNIRHDILTAYEKKYQARIEELNFVIEALTIISEQEQY